MSQVTTPTDARTDTDTESTDDTVTAEERARALAALEARSFRALTQLIRVEPEMYTSADPHARDDEYKTVVFGQGGEEYIVSYGLGGETGGCTCPDWEKRQPEGGCKHMRRVDYARGAKSLPRGVTVDMVTDLADQREKFAEAAERGRAIAPDL